MKLIRWTLLTVFVISLATVVFVGSTGYTGALAKNGKYYATYRSTRSEVSRAEFEQMNWRDRTSGIAVVTMMVSLFGFIAVERIRPRRRRS